MKKRKSMNLVFLKNNTQFSWNVASYQPPPHLTPLPLLSSLFCITFHFKNSWIKKINGCINYFIQKNTTKAHVNIFLYFYFLASEIYLLIFLLFSYYRTKPVCFVLIFSVTYLVYLGKYIRIRRVISKQTSWICKNCV